MNRYRVTIRNADGTTQNITVTATNRVFVPGRARPRLDRRVAGGGKRPKIVKIELIPHPPATPSRAAGATTPDHG
jgi:hypothetical protein